MQLIFSTGSLHTYGTERCFALAAEAAFDGVELMVDHRWDTRQPAYLLELIDRYQMPILAVHSPFLPVPGWPPDHASLIKASVTLAEELGAPVVVHHLPENCGYIMLSTWERRHQIPVSVWDRHREYRNWLTSVYPAIQAETTVKLCIENMPAQRLFGRTRNGNTWNQGDEILRFPYITLDTTHLATWELEPSAVYERWKHHVHHVHLSNYDGQEHRRPEEGQLDLQRFLGGLVKNGYTGAVSLELHPDALHAGDTDAVVLQFMRNSLGACRLWLANAGAPARERATTDGDAGRGK